MSEETQRLTALPPELLAHILRQAGAQHVTVASVREDLAAGAPANEDGTVNLIAYTAWLVREVAYGS